MSFQVLLILNLVTFGYRITWSHMYIQINLVTGPAKKCCTPSCLRDTPWNALEYSSGHFLSSDGSTFKWWASNWKFITFRHQLFFLCKMCKTIEKKVWIVALPVDQNIFFSIKTKIPNVFKHFWLNRIFLLYIIYKSVFKVLVLLDHTDSVTYVKEMYQEEYCLWILAETTQFLLFISSPLIRCPYTKR